MTKGKKDPKDDEPEEIFELIQDVCMVCKGFRLEVFQDRLKCQDCNNEQHSYIQLIAKLHKYEKPQVVEEFRSVCPNCLKPVAVVKLFRDNTYVECVHCGQCLGRYISDEHLKLSDHDEWGSNVSKQLIELKQENKRLIEDEAGRADYWDVLVLEKRNLETRLADVKRDLKDERKEHTDWYDCAVERGYKVDELNEEIIRLKQKYKRDTKDLDYYIGEDNKNILLSQKLAGKEREIKKLNDELHKYRELPQGWIADELEKAKRDLIDVKNKFEHYTNELAMYRDTNCYNCGEPLSPGKNERMGFICFDPGDSSVGEEAHYYYECIQCGNEELQKQLGRHQEFYESVKLIKYPYSDLSLLGNLIEMFESEGKTKYECPNCKDLDQELEEKDKVLTECLHNEVKLSNLVDDLGQDLERIGKRCDYLSADKLHQKKELERYQAVGKIIYEKVRRYHGLEVGHFKDARLDVLMILSDIAILAKEFETEAESKYECPNCKKLEDDLNGLARLLDMLRGDYDEKCKQLEKAKKQCDFFDKEYHDQCNILKALVHHDFIEPDSVFINELLRGDIKTEEAPPLIPSITLDAEEVEAFLEDLGDLEYSKDTIEFIKSSLDEYKKIKKRSTSDPDDAFSDHPRVKNTEE